MIDDPRPEAHLRIRVLFGRAMIGPGKADLLGLIAETGSIAQAGRRMKMSYKRAWSLVETMNGDFREPLVESTRGGAKGGGARLTKAGEVALTAYRRLEQNATEAGETEIAALRELLGDMSDGK